MPAGSAPRQVNWGQIGGMLRAFKQARVTHLVIVGRVRRPDLTRLKPDFGLLRAIPTILRIMASGGDDGVLRGVIRFFEAHGLTVIGPLDVAPALALPSGPLARRASGAGDESDIRLGFALVRMLGDFDVGQSVVVRGGQVLAIEGAEGTDRMLSRVTAVPGELSGTLVKRPKPKQEMRVDVPVIGPETVARVAQAGLAGIAVQAGAVMVAQRTEMAQRADDLGIFVTGVEDMATADPAETGPASGNAPATDSEDIARGVAILRLLRPHAPCRAVVVARKYVLAVDSGEGVEAVLTRAASLRQWGSHRVRKRVGIAVIAEDETIGMRHIELAAQAGLLGLAVAGSTAIEHTVAAAARASGLFIQTVAESGGGQA